MIARRVTLIGGSGFVGSELAFRLASLVDEVVVLSRHPQRVRVFRVLPNVHVRKADVHSADSLTAAVRDSDVVVNLVGILNETGSGAENTFEGAHSSLTGTVIDALRSAAVPRYLHMSSLGANAEAGTSKYLRTKGRAEQLVRASGDHPAWTIFRPSIIFGPNDAFFNRFAALLRFMPVFPLACPNARMAPVFVGDVCQAMISAIEDDSLHGKAIDLCGPGVYTLRELVEYTAAQAGLKRYIIGLPDRAARLQARVMEHIPGKPFTRDNYLSLQSDTICPAGCPLQPTSIDAIVPQYLGGKDVLGRLQSRRRHARR